MSLIVPPIRAKLVEQSRILADLLASEVEQIFSRLQSAEAEAMSRIQALAPVDEFDLKAAAKYLGLPARTLQRRIRDRLIAYRRDGRRVLFTRTALDEYRKAGLIRAQEGRPLPC